MKPAMEDVWGAPVSGSSEAMSGTDAFARGFVRYRPEATDVLGTAQTMPDSALANLYAGMLWMFLERPEAAAKAEPFRAAAAACGDMNARERGLLALLRAWQVYDSHAIQRIVTQLVAECPADLVALKLGQYHAFNRGDAHAMLALSNAARPANTTRAPWHAMHAFALEQRHDLDGAEAAATRALELEAGEPWAHHALAHIHLGRGRPDLGRAFLAANSAHWQGLNSFMFTHNWWHVALCEIAEGDAPAALAIHDERCWGVQPDYSQDQIGSVSLLARLECAGVDVGERWMALRPYLETRGEDVEQPFLTLQYLYGLARAGSPVADSLHAAIRAQIDCPVVSQDRQLWRRVGLPVAEGLLAHARNDHAGAARYFAMVSWSAMVPLGGSHAQRDLFDQLSLDALWRAGRRVEAAVIMTRRLRFEPHNPVLQRRLADCA